MPMVEVFNEYLELYNQISSGGIKWSVRKDDADTKSVVGSSIDERRRKSQIAHGSKR